jgi:cobalt/nickel transport system permease protein
MADSAATPAAPGSTLSLPDWLASGAAPAGVAGAGRRVRLDFVGRTLLATAEVVQRVLFAEEIARQDRPLQRASPAVKVVCFLALMLAAGLSRSLPPLILIYASCVLLTLLGGLDLRTFLLRTWLVVAVFTGLVVLPGTTSLVTPGDPVLTLLRFGSDAHLGPVKLPADVSLTRPGLAGSLLVVLRAAVSVSLATILTLTTSWFELLRGLGTLGLPPVVGMLLTLTYRYIFVLLTVVRDMYYAWQARFLGSTPGRAGRLLGAAAAYALFLRSEVLAREVHQAMLARGFRGRAAFASRPAYSATASGVLVALTIAALAGAYVWG